MKGYDCSLHIGRNDKDPQVMRENDGMWYASQLCDEAAKRGLLARCLLGPQATRGDVLAALREAATTLRGGDTLLITYTGHGCPTTDQDHDEADGYDEAWQLADGELTDDELYACWADFAPRVEIRVLADTCYSATGISRNYPHGPSSDEVIIGICSDKNAQNPASDRTPKHRPRSLRPLPRCSVFLLAAAAEDREAWFGALSSRTLKTLRRWREEGKAGTWDDLRAAASGLGVPGEYQIRGTDPAEGTERSVAFSPRQ